MASPPPSVELLKNRVRVAVVLLLGAVIGISVWSLAAEYRQTLRNAEHQLAGYARALAEHSESAFAESDRVLKDVLHDLPGPERIKNLDQERLFRELQRQVGNSPQIGSLFLVDENGEMFLDSVRFPPAKPSVADREYFHYYRTTPGADLSLSRPVMSRLVQRWRFNLMRPLNHPTRPFAGLLAVAFEVDYFTDFFTQESIGRGARIALIRTDGAPLAFSPYQEGVYQHTFKDTILFREKLPASPHGTFHAGPGSSRFDSAPSIVSYRSLSRFPVVALVSLDKNELLRSWEMKGLLQLGMTFGLCLLVVALMRLLIRHLDQLQSAQTALQSRQEELRLKAAQIDAAHDAILMVDMDGRLLQANNAFCRMTGYSLEEACGKKLTEIEPPEFAVQVPTNLGMLRENGEATFESAYLHKNGSTLPVEISARIQQSEGGTFILSIVRDISERKRNERREVAKAGLLEKLASDADLDELLVHIVRYVEQELETGLCSVLLADDNGLRLHHGAAPSLPDSYNRAVDGLRIARGKGSCGTAAYLRQRVITENIDHDPFWNGFTPAREAGLKSCWSTPVISASGELLGTFAIYHRTCMTPGENELQLLDTAAHLASIAIARFKAERQRKDLESQLHHVQRIEAVGQLAGGIAHDFNNLLTPILVYAEMIQKEVPQGPVAAKAGGIISAAGKARDLTQQLLSFGRKQILTLKPLDLNEVIGSFHDILRRTIRENIAIYLQTSPGAVTIQADRGQIEQILLNLAVNAQDAIQGNGSIVMETGHIFLDAEFARLHPGMRPGRYALLSFIDSGCGMDEKTLSHIFEPFFTTKPVGHGTGLGLATVYGIVKQHEGYIAVSSRPGEGTIFNIYLPLSDHAAAVPKGGTAAPTPPAAHPENQTLLVVEDNEMVRAMTVELLRLAGYRVLEAELPSVAVELNRSHSSPIDLLVTDVMMPEMSGMELYEKLHGSRPGLRVLYMSGYTSETFVHKGRLEESVNFLQKPFTTELLLERVREVLADASP